MAVSALRSNYLARGVLDRSRQCLRLVPLAIGLDLCKIPLQAVIVENAAVSGRVVVAAHPVLHELPPVRIKCKPLTAFDVGHVQGAVPGIATALKAAATIRTLYFIAILRCELLLLACCIFQA